MSSSVAPPLRASRSETSALPNRHTCQRSKVMGHHVMGVAYLEVAVGSDSKSVAGGAEMVAHGCDEANCSSKSRDFVRL